MSDGLNKYVSTIIVNEFSQFLLMVHMLDDAIFFYCKNYSLQYRRNNRIASCCNYRREHFQYPPTLYSSNHRIATCTHIHIHRLASDRSVVLVACWPPANV